MIRRVGRVERLKGSRDWSAARFLFLRCLVEAASSRSFANLPPVESPRYSPRHGRHKRTFFSLFCSIWAYSSRQPETLSTNVGPILLFSSSTSPLGVFKIRRIFFKLFLNLFLCLLRQDCESDTLEIAIRRACQTTRFLLGHLTSFRELWRAPLLDTWCFVAYA